MAKASIRYGFTLRKRYDAVLKQKRARYRCDVCGKLAVKRIGNGIWQCKSCGATYAGGAYTMKTEAGEASMRMLSQLKEAMK